MPRPRSPSPPTRLTLVQEVLACLMELTFPVRGSVPYLVELLDSADDGIVLAALEYLRTWRLEEARQHVQELLTRRFVSPAVRRAAARTLEDLASPANERAAG